MCKAISWLVVWNMAFMTFHILGMSSSQLTFTPSFFRGVGLNHQADSVNTFHKNTESSWTKLDESGCRRSSDWRPCPRKVRPPWNWGSSQGVPIGFLVGLLERIPILHDASLYNDILCRLWLYSGRSPASVFQIFFKEAFSRGLFCVRIVEGSVDG